MEKEQWQRLYEVLDNIYSDFHFAYSDYKDGKNKKIRTEAERKVDNAIRLADYHIRRNGEAFELLTGGENIDGFSRVVIYDEFVLPRYFANDLSEFLDKIKLKIKSLE